MLIASQVTWEAMARFWSDVLLYLAPSDNMLAHADAIDRGGELLTLIWALLGHVGFVSSANRYTHVTKIVLVKISGVGHVVTNLHAPYGNEIHVELLAPVKCVEVFKINL